MPRLDYSLMIDGTPFAGGGQPGVEPLDMVAYDHRIDPFTFNAILGAWFRPVPSLQFGLAGQVIPANVRDEQQAQVTPLDPRWARSS